jgi:hypothetical protein
LDWRFNPNNCEVSIKLLPGWPGVGQLSTILHRTPVEMRFYHGRPSKNPRDRKKQNCTYVTAMEPCEGKIDATVPAQARIDSEADREPDSQAPVRPKRKRQPQSWITISHCVKQDNEYFLDALGQPQIRVRTRILSKLTFPIAR